MTDLKTLNQEEQQWLEMLRRDGNMLGMIENQTEELILTAVRQNGMALGQAKFQTEEICLEAMKQNPYALKCVQEQTEAICLEAMRQNPNLSYDIDEEGKIDDTSDPLEYLSQRKERYLWEAIRQEGGRWYYLLREEVNERVMLEALKSNPDGFSDMPLHRVEEQSLFEMLFEESKSYPRTVIRWVEDCPELKELGWMIRFDPSMLYHSYFREHQNDYHRHYLEIADFVMDQFNFFALGNELYFKENKVSSKLKGVSETEAKTYSVEEMISLNPIALGCVPMFAKTSRLCRYAIAQQHKTNLDLRCFSPYHVLDHLVEKGLL